MTQKKVYMMYWQFGRHTKGSIKYPLRVYSDLRIAKILIRQLNKNSSYKNNNKWFFLKTLPFDEIPYNQRLIDFFVFNTEGEKGYEDSLGEAKADSKYFQRRVNEERKMSSDLRKQVRKLRKKLDEQKNKM